MQVLKAKEEGKLEEVHLLTAPKMVFKLGCWVIMLHNCFVFKQVERYPFLHLVCSEKQL